MSDLQNTLNGMEKLIKGELEEVRSDIQEVKAGSARHDELSEKHDRVLADFDALQVKLDGIETAMNRVAAAGEAEGDSPEVAEHKNAFDNYLRTAHEGDLRELERKTLSVGSDPDGGYVAPEEMSNRVLSIVYETSPMRTIATVQTTDKKEVEFLVDKDEAGAEWVAESGVTTNNTTPQFGKLKIGIHKMATEPMMTEEMLQDSGINIESWLGQKVGEKFGRSQNSAFVNGDGVGKPQGILGYASGTAWGKIQQVTSAASGVIDELDLIDLMGTVKTDYMQGASFVMNRQTNTLLRKLQDSNGLFLFTGQDLIERTLFGYKVVDMDDMPGVSAGNLAIGFGNFGVGYTIIDRLGLNIIRDPLTSKGFIKYYTTSRVGGAVTNFEAIKLLKVKA